MLGGAFLKTSDKCQIPSELDKFTNLLVRIVKRNKYSEKVMIPGEKDIQTQDYIICVFTDSKK